MIAAIGFGVSAFMATFVVFRAVSGDPMPWKSGELFVPQIDNWGLKAHGPDGEPPDLLSYIDATALTRVNPDARQTAIYPIAVPMAPINAQSSPPSIDGYAVYADFFNMFEVPFLYGGSWGRSGDAQHRNVVIISEKLNQKAFEGKNSIGQQITINNKNYQVVGVVGNWNPKPRFYDVANSNGFKEGQPEFFIPFSSSIDAKIATKGSNNCNSHAGVGWDGWLQSQCTWISFWVELDTQKDVSAYQAMLHNYAEQQRQAGRFNWPANVKLRNLTQWLDYEKVAPEESKVSLMIAMAFLVVCLVNTAGLLLAKFMRRASEISLRRALGASQRDIYRQFLIEASLIGLAGGCLGLVLTWFGIVNIDLLFDPDIARLATMSLWLVVATFLVALIATVLAAFYPIWRAAGVQPAWQLKAN
jgi:putative ABC transport system permease protein